MYEPHPQEDYFRSLAERLSLARQLNDPTQAAAEQAYQAQSLEGAPSPNAVTGGVVDTGYADAVAEGDPNSPEYAAFVGKDRNADGSKKKAKKKSNYGEFFALLRKMKSEDAEGKKDTRKALKDLVKQLDSSVATKGNATGSVSAL